jgi:hypothetical protein
VALDFNFKINFKVGHTNFDDGGYNFDDDSDHNDEDRLESSVPTLSSLIIVYQETFLK